MSNNTEYLYVYMIKLADIETGAVLRWRDNEASVILNKPKRTIRFHRKLLERVGAIVCHKNQHSQTILIQEWGNVREKYREVICSCSITGASINQGKNDVKPESGNQIQSVNHRNSDLPLSNINIARDLIVSTEEKPKMDSNSSRNIDIALRGLLSLGFSCTKALSLISKNHSEKISLCLELFSNVKQINHGILESWIETILSQPDIQAVTRSYLKYLKSPPTELMDRLYPLGYKTDHKEIFFYYAIDPKKVDRWISFTRLNINKISNPSEYLLYQLRNNKE
jgi:hypothetical protein